MHIPCALPLWCPADQVTYVEQCIAQDCLKAASRAVRQFGLRDEFPDVESMYRHKTVWFRQRTSCRLLVVRGHHGACICKGLVMYCFLQVA